MSALGSGFLPMFDKRVCGAVVREVQGGGCHGLNRYRRSGMVEKVLRRERPWGSDLGGSDISLENSSMLYMARNRFSSHEKGPSQVASSTCLSSE